MGNVRWSPPFRPAKGSPLFDLGDDEMEMGVGIHGEPGRSRLDDEVAGLLAAPAEIAIRTF